MTNYTTGSASVESGSTTVTGSGTAWALAAVAGGLFSCQGLAIPIASVTDDATLVLAYAWPGTDETGAAYAIQRENSAAANVVDLFDKLSRVLVTLGLAGIHPNASGTITQRDALTLDEDDEGYIFLYAEPGHDLEFYRWSGTDWQGPFDVKGEDGDQGPAGVGEGGYGVPSGGTTGQVLAKASGTDGDAEWSDPSGSVDSVNGKTGVVVIDTGDISDFSTSAQALIDATVSDYLPLTGGTMTGAILGSVGSVGAPGYSFAGDADTGWWNTADKIHGSVGGGEIWRATSSGIAIGAGFDPAASLHIQAPAATGKIQIDGEASVNISANLYNSSGPGPAWNSTHGRGTIAAPTAALQNDILGRFQFLGVSNSSGGTKTGGRMDYKVLSATPSDSDMESQWTVFLCPPGSATVGEALRFEHATGLSMFGANPVIDQNRHIRLRSYTVATKPATATAGAMIYVSDESGGAVVAFGDGTNWRRVTDRAVVS